MKREEMMVQLRELRRKLADRAMVAAAGADIQALDQALADLHESTWIKCEDQMPPEKESIFAKLSGTERWMEGMFLQISETVQVCKELEDGHRKVYAACTHDGVWHDTNTRQGKIICWRPLAQVPSKEEAVM